MKGHGYGFVVDIGRLDPGQSPDLAVKRPDTALISPSAEARRQGWIYYVLPPGTYYLTVYDMEKKGTLAPGFLLSVSGEKQLVYAGTLDIACKKLFLRGPGQCSGVSLTDEGDAAKVLAQAHFAQYGPISTSLMSKYDKAVAVSQRPAIFPMGYVTGAGTKDLVSPEWVKRSIGRAAAPETAMLAAGLMGVPGLNYAGASLQRLMWPTCLWALLWVPSPVSQPRRNGSPVSRSWPRKSRRMTLRPPCKEN